MLQIQDLSWRCKASRGNFDGSTSGLQDQLSLHAPSKEFWVQLEQLPEHPILQSFHTLRITKERPKVSRKEKERDHSLHQKVSQMVLVEMQRVDRCALTST